MGWLGVSGWKRVSNLLIKSVFFFWDVDVGSELEEVEGRMLWWQRAAWSKQRAMTEVYGAEKGYKEVKASFAFHIL